MRKFLKKLLKKSFLTLFIPEFDLDLDLKMEKVFQTVMRKMLFVFMQKRKFRNIVSFIDLFNNFTYGKKQNNFSSYDFLRIAIFSK